MTSFILIRIQEHHENHQFPIELSFCEKGNLIRFEGYLPPIPASVFDCYEELKCLYGNLESTRIRIPERQPKKRIKTWQDNIIQRIKLNQDIEEKLIEEISQWLNSSSLHWNPIKREIVGLIRLAKTQSEKPVILLCCKANNLKKLPLHLWNLFEDNGIEVCYYFGNLQTPPKTPFLLRDTLEVIAIQGGGNEIEVEQEQKLWNELKKITFHRVKIKWLKNPSLGDFHQLWQKRYDVIYFAGHSQTIVNADVGSRGRWYINSQEFLTIKILKKTLEQCSKNGLKLAIFNSCQGMGITEDLAQLNVANLKIIFMREPIPNCVAPKFLQHLLTALEQGRTLFESMVEARGKLKEVSEFQLFRESDLKVRLPGIGLIPAIAWVCNMTASPFNLSQFHQKINKWLFLFSVSSFSVLFVVLLRSLGLLQLAELKFYDALIRLRPNQQVDERLLLVQITEGDVQNQPSSTRGAASLSDLSLQRLKEKLEKSKATAIGSRYLP